MKRISENLFGSELRAENIVADLERKHCHDAYFLGADAQLVADQKEHDEIVRGMIKEIEDKKQYYELLSPADGMDCILINRAWWQAYKQKLLGGGK